MVRASLRILFLLCCVWSAAAQGPEHLPRARWMQDGFIDAGGSHEPLLFVVRRGGPPLDAREQYERSHSEEVIRRLQSQGVEVFHTFLYKGFGMAAERPAVEDAVRVAELAHRHGLKVDSYIQWNTLMYETFFAEEPRAQDWIQRDASGQPILLTYGYQQSYRYRPCFSSQEYLDYLKKIVRFAVQEVKTDFIHFDNFDLNPEPDSCHCRHCVRGFREFLKRKYSPERRRERFGFDNVDYVSPPQWNRQNPPQRMEILFDPAIQEWVDFRCQLMADALRQMSMYARSLHPNVAIEINPHGITGGNRAWEAGLDHARLLKWTDAFWTEEENITGLTQDGRLLSKIRSYKLARAFDNVLLAYISDHPVSMAESLAFNQTIGFAGQDPLSPDMLRYIAFYRKHRELYKGSRDVPAVAVLRSYPSIAYHNARAQLSAILVEQALIEARIPFVYVFDEQLSDLSRHKVLILPDSECLSQSQIQTIRQFVAGGGGLVATGQAGLYDEWRRARVRPGLEGLIDSQARPRDYEESVTASHVTGAPTRKQHQGGRVAYFPDVAFDGLLPEPAPYFAIGERSWKRPANWREIAEAVRWAAGDELPVRIEGPPVVAANLTSQEENKRMLLHLVNFDARRQAEVRGVEASLRLPRDAKISTVRVLSPETENEQILPVRASGGEIAFTLPELKTYAVVVAAW